MVNEVLPNEVLPGVAIEAPSGLPFGGNTTMATLNIRINDDAKSFVERKANEDQTSEADIVRRALEAYRFLEEVKKDDGEVILKRKDGHFERLVRL
jgi:hypothetical protein